MKIVLKNSKLYFVTKGLLSGKIALPYSYIWAYDGILINSSASNISGVTTGNNVYIYDIKGLPVGTKINLSAGNVSNMNKWNNYSKFRHYITGKAIATDSTTPNNIIQSDSVIYSLNDDNSISFSAVSIIKQSTDEITLWVSGNEEPIITIDVSGVVSSGEDELTCVSTMSDTRIEEDGSTTGSISNMKVFKYAVTNKSWYIVFTYHRRAFTTSSACVVFLNDEGVIIDTIQTIVEDREYGGAYAIYTPEGSKYILVQGDMGSAYNLPDREVSTIVTEAKIIES